MGAQMAFETILAHVIGLREAGLDVAPAGGGAAADIRIWHLVLDLGMRRMDLRCVRLHRLERIEDRGQNFVFDLDRLKGLLRRDLIDGGDRCNFLADVNHPSAREYLLVWRIARRLHEAVLDALGVVHRDHRLDAGQGGRLRGVQPHDAGMRVRATQNASDQHAWQFDILGVDGAASDLVGPVLAADALADIVEFAHGLVRSLAVIASPDRRPGRRPGVWRRRSRCSRCTGKDCLPALS